MFENKSTLSKKKELKKRKAFFFLPFAAKRPGVNAASVINLLLARIDLLPASAGFTSRRGLDLRVSGAV